MKRKPDAFDIAHIIELNLRAQDAIEDVRHQEALRWLATQQSFIEGFSTKEAISAYQEAEKGEYER